MESPWRHCTLVVLALMMLCLLTTSRACSSRAIAKPRNPSTAVTTSRPNITFPILSCPPAYAAWYCLNEATCFIVEIQTNILYNCQCANGFMGPRCEYKDVDGSYLPTRRRAMLETASIASGATLALIFMIVLCLMLYVHYRKRTKMKFDDRVMTSHENDGMDIDELDGGGIGKGPVMRPFGPHHYHVLPMSATFK